ncbi:MAG TPA: hypothetical protein VLA97_08745 [Nocardioidaceae bacterium]|nr:hypothetical protein [Nocardioidaceae bacterium]
MSTLMSQARTRVPRLAEAAVERARLTVVPRRVQKAPRVPFVTLVSLLLVTGVVGLLLFNTHMQQASFVATSMEQRAEVLAAKEQSLQMELDRLRDPQRVAARAQALGMVPAPSPAFIRLSDGKVLGQPEAATPDQTMRITPLPTRKPKELVPDPVVVELEQATTPGDRAGQNLNGAERASAARISAGGTKNKQKPSRTQGGTR